MNVNIKILSVAFLTLLYGFAMSKSGYSRISDGILKTNTEKQEWIFKSELKEISFHVSKNESPIGFDYFSDFNPKDTFLGKFWTLSNFNKLTEHHNVLCLATKYNIVVQFIIQQQKFKHLFPFHNFW